MPVTIMQKVPRIPGMIPIGPFSRIDAVACQTFQWMPYRSLVKNGLNALRMARAQHLRMLPFPC
jgi:hypothetical protein